MTSTVPPDGASLHRYPGTSCLATINLSLRDKSHSPIKAPDNYLSAYGVETRAKFFNLFGAIKHPKLHNYLGATRTFSVKGSGYSRLL